MGHQLERRRRQIRAKGRGMQLGRGPSASAVTVDLVGVPRSYRPGEIEGPIQAGDQQVEILNDEIAAAAWPAPPRNPDRLRLDGRMVTVQAARPVYEGETLIGWSLWVRG